MQDLSVLHFLLPHLPEELVWQHGIPLPVVCALGLEKGTRQILELFHLKIQSPSAKLFLHIRQAEKIKKAGRVCECVVVVLTAFCVVHVQACVKQVGFPAHLTRQELHLSGSSDLAFRFLKKDFLHYSVDRLLFVFEQFVQLAV
jgi:hypothetical protein